MCIFIERFLAQRAQKFTLIGRYRAILTGIIDSNVIELAIQLPTGWTKFDVKIRNVEITKEHMSSTFDFRGLINHFLQNRELCIDILNIIDLDMKVLGDVYLFDDDEMEYKNIKEQLVNWYASFLLMIPEEREQSVSFNVSSLDNVDSDPTIDIVESRKNISPIVSDFEDEESENESEIRESISENESIYYNDLDSLADDKITIKIHSDDIEDWTNLDKEVEILKEEIKETN